MRDDEVKPQQKVFRKPYFSAFGLGVDLFSMVGFTIAAFQGLQVGTLFPALIFAGITYGIWLITWQSAVRISPSGVVVDNGLVRHVIPWAELSEIDADSGLRFRLRDGSAVGSIMFGGSVIGVLLGYRYTRGVAERMRAARAEMLAGAGEPPPSAGYSYFFHMSPWPPLAILALMGAIALVSFVSK